MLRLRSLCLSVALAVAAGLGLSSPAQAAGGQTPGTYTRYSFTGTTALDDVTFGTTVEADPGRGKVFWAHQHRFTTGVYGYVGQQRWRTGTGRFLFSMWGSTAATPGAAGTYCQTFTESGSGGYTCRFDQAFEAGHHYTYRIALGSQDGWYTATVTDTTAGTSFVLGSLQVGAGARIDTAGMSDWVEYFDWNNSAARCEDEPYSRARFDLPVGTSTGGSPVTASIGSTSLSSTCSAYADVSQVTGGSVHEDAIGNSASGSITGIGGKCADIAGGSSADGTPVKLWTCADVDHQNWVLAQDGTVHALFKCMTAVGGNVVLTTCDGSPGQQWQRVGSTLINQGMCLDAQGGSSANGTPLIVYSCSGGSNQNWTTPV
ncbi:ricin-type beta-trefoil lectin domain protein [Streptomyces wedmorensis]|uniref:ricin-type beta-trefoil lectin domain protein n=1 Tax=Streptomyces wedmorensis TaxID=43759 RepID=UPI0037AF0730